MHKSKRTGPPRFFERLLAFFVTGYTRAIIMGDLEEEYFCILEVKGKKKADFWYAGQVFKIIA